jgi:hypothetical protein
MYQNKSCEGFIKIINLFRKLWIEHVVWTRFFIISTAADLGDLKFVTARLLRNPADFKAALKPYYGEDNAKKFSDLLTEHLMIAAQLVNAAKAGKAEVVDEERKKWYANADEIADFLSKINPNWSRAHWTIMLHDHLQLTETEATERLTGKYEQDVALFDAIEDQALTMADDMADGIIKQFLR